MQQLSAQDALFLYLETAKMPMHIGGVYIFDNKEKPFVFSEFKEYLRQRLHLSRIFRQRLVEVPLNLDQPYWADDPDFDLDYHICHVALPKPGGRRELVELAAQIYNPPMERSRPMWKLTFVSGLENMEGFSENAFAMVAQVHHAMIDGGSGVEIMASILHFGPDVPNISPPKKAWKPERLPTGAELMLKSTGNMFSTPMKLFNLVKNAAPVAFDLAKELGKNLTKFPLASGSNGLGGRRSSFLAPKTPFNAPATGHKIFSAIDVSLAKIKAIKNKVEGAKVNDVLLAACGGALRRYLLEKKNLPKKSMIAMAPISVRAKNEQGKMGNRVSAMLVNLGTDEADALTRLIKIRKKTKKSKEMGRALGADKIMELVPSQVSATASRLYTRMALSELHRPFFNLVITNVPGPPFPMYMNGFKMVGHYGFGTVLNGMGLMIVIFSHAGTISICATSIKEVAPDLAQLTNYIRSEIDVLARDLKVVD